MGRRAMPCENHSYLRPSSLGERTVKDHAHNIQKAPLWREPEFLNLLWVHYRLHPSQQNLNDHFHRNIVADQSGFPAFSKHFPKMLPAVLPSLSLHELKHLRGLPLNVANKGRTNFIHVSLQAGEELMEQRQEIR